MHSFFKKAPFMKELLIDNDLRNFINNAANLAKEKQSVELFEVGNYKDYNMDNPAWAGDKWSPKYFGFAIEALCEVYLEQYGSMYGIKDVKSTEDYENVMSDTGVDHYARSDRKQKIDSVRIAYPDSPVFIQTKGVLNSRYEFTTNDGARLPNFFMNAQTQALKTAHSYQARYVLFTTGKGLHYKLDENSGKLCEVINYNKISKMVDGNVAFWNVFRRKGNIDEQPTGNTSQGDQEGLINLAAD